MSLESEYSWKNEFFYLEYIDIYTGGPRDIAKKFWKRCSYKIQQSDSKPKPFKPHRLFSNQCKTYYLNKTNIRLKTNIIMFYFINISFNNKYCELKSQAGK